ncbi:unnamed protein product [Eruca vesicaria subsp. sativa]|uniref:TF-B3 domain-containing protein n=1 Tax=Eruca vesicaria subsp. sativa TaxID=29727 RepID=A0ABC8LWC7_ERUVS|nr:unnamed protein product [Eruca vesicaria subsp. sativa]
MSMYYGDLTQKWSNFSLLVDKAVLLYEQQHKRTLEKKKTVSWKQEDEQRIFHHFPRRPRSSSFKKSLRNLIIGASSSFRLFDLNKIPSEKTNPQNPSSSLSPSSSCSCLTENNNTSRKRRAVQEGNPSFKKAKKVSPLFSSWEGKDTPDWVVQLMKNMKGASDPMQIFEKTLFETDVKPVRKWSFEIEEQERDERKDQSRLSIPFHKLIRKDFLTPVETRIIEEDINNSEKMGVGAVLVDQGTRKWGVFLKRWEMNGSWNYALVCGWNDVVKANGLKDGDSISLWSFRCRGVLCFALVPLPM